MAAATPTTVTTSPADYAVFKASTIAKVVSVIANEFLYIRGLQHGQLYIWMAKNPQWMTMTYILSKTACTFDNNRLNLEKAINILVAERFVQRSKSGTGKKDVFTFDFVNSISKLQVMATDMLPVLIGRIAPGDGVIAPDEDGPPTKRARTNTNATNATDATDATDSNNSDASAVTGFAGGGVGGVGGVGGAAVAVDVDAIDVGNGVAEDDGVFGGHVSDSTKLVGLTLLLQWLKDPALKLPNIASFPHDSANVSMAPLAASAVLADPVMQSLKEMGDRADAVRGLVTHQDFDAFKKTGSFIRRDSADYYSDVMRARGIAYNAVEAADSINLNHVTTNTVHTEGGGVVCYKPARKALGNTVKKGASKKMMTQVFARARVCARAHFGHENGVGAGGRGTEG